jgi:hypothetical protein
VRNFANFINAYLEYSDHSEAPEKFHLWTAVSCIAGALRRRVWIDMKYFQWTPNMYIIFVAPPGIVSKSTTASIGMNLLRQVDGIKFGPDAVTWQALVQRLQEAKEMFQLHDGEEMYHTMSALTCVCSEFGNFLNPHDREMVDALVSLWDGQVGTWTKVTKTQGSDLIENPWVNVLACTTPDWIAGNFPDYMVGGGFTSRCVFVYADKKRKLVAYPKYEASHDHSELQLKLVQDLGHIANVLAGEYHLSASARTFGERWYQSHYDKPPAGLMGERFAGYIARKQTHIHKLAMVLAAAEHDKLIIEQHHLSNAATIVDTLELDMPKVFNRIGVTTDQKSAQRIVAHVWTHGDTHNRDLFGLVFSHMSYREFQGAVDGAFAAGYLSRKQVGNDVIWGRGKVRPGSEDGLVKAEIGRGADT